MIATHVTWLHTEAKSMIENERRRDLSLLYPLLRPIPSGLTPLVQKLTEHITQQGLQAIESLQGENVRRRAIINFKFIVYKYNTMLHYRVILGTHTICGKHTGCAS